MSVDIFSLNPSFYCLPSIISPFYITFLLLFYFFCINYFSARLPPSPLLTFTVTYFQNIDLFIWPHQVLVAYQVFDHPTRCSMQTLSCGMWDLVHWPGTELTPPALGAWSLSHWTTREVLDSYTVSMILLVVAYDIYQSQHDLAFWLPIYTMQDLWAP